MEAPDIKGVAKDMDHFPNEAKLFEVSKFLIANQIGNERTL